MLRGLLDRLRRRTRPLPVEEHLQISYTPRPDGDADPGEVVWTWVPYEDDPRQGKDRPVLVIGSVGRDLAVLPLTSKDHTDRGDSVPLGSGRWDRSARVSYVKLDRVLRVAPTKVRREGATLDRARFDQVVAELTRYAHHRAGRAERGPASSASLTRRSGDCYGAPTRGRRGAPPRGRSGS